MTLTNKREFVLLSELVSKLENNDYYLTYAKSLALTENISNAPLQDNELISAMFSYFISIDELSVYRNEKVRHTEKPSKHVNPIETDDFHLIKKSEFDGLQQNEVFVKVKDLKKLYANKCIVFPSSLLN